MKNEDKKTVKGMKKEEMRKKTKNKKKKLQIRMK